MTGLLPPAQLAQAQAYSEWFRIGWALGLGIEAVYCVLLLRYGIRPLFALAARIATACADRTRRLRALPVIRAFPRALDALWEGPGWGTALIFAWLLLLLSMLVFFPQDLFFEFLLPHRFGMAHGTFARWLRDRGIGLALSAGLLGALAFGLFGLMRRMRVWWWVLGLVVGVGVLFAGALDSYGGKIYFQQRPLSNGPLRHRITQLMAEAHVPFRDVEVLKTSVETRRLQAYFAGEGPSRMIIVTDTLVHTLDPDEVLAAIAHEAGHIHQSRTLGRIASALAMLLLCFGADRLFRMAARRGWFGVRSPSDIRLLPLLQVAFLGVMVLAGPLASWRARVREHEADLYALNLTRNPRAFERMLIALAKTNLEDPSPPEWSVWLTSNHPPLSARVASARAWARRHRAR